MTSLGLIPHGGPDNDDFHDNHENDDDDKGHYDDDVDDDKNCSQVLRLTRLPVA